VLHSVRGYRFGGWPTFGAIRCVTTRPTIAKAVNIAPARKVPLEPTPSQSAPARIHQYVFARAQSGADVLPHQSGFLVLEDVAMIHERVLAPGRPIEGDKKLRPVFDQRHVFPTREMRWRRRSGNGQNAEQCAVDMKRNAVFPSHHPFPDRWRRLAQQNISLESNRAASPRGEPPHGGDIAGSSGQPVPVILITYTTTEDAVREALAAVGRDKVILGKPQVIRIEKN